MKQPCHYMLSSHSSHNPANCKVLGEVCLFPWVHRWYQVHQSSVSHAFSPHEAVLALKCHHASWFAFAAFFRGCMGIVGGAGWNWEMGVKKTTQNNMKTASKRQKQAGLAQQGFATSVLEHVGTVSSLLPSHCVLDILCLRSHHCPAFSLATCFVHTWSWHQRK